MANGITMRTFVSPVNNPTGQPIKDLNGRQLYWVDQLFSGGIYLPEGVLTLTEDPLLWVVTGPPGVGKTTFALDLCRNVATFQQTWNEVLTDPKYKDELQNILKVVQPKSNIKSQELLERFRVLAWEGKITPIGGTLEQATSALIDAGSIPEATLETPIRTLYVSLETPSNRILENMGNFGWDTTNIKFIRKHENPCANTVQMWLIGKEFYTNDGQTTYELLSGLKGHWEEMWSDECSPGIVVIDSLNTLPTDEGKPSGIIPMIKAGLGTRTWIIMVICEGGQELHKAWEYEADIITRLDVGMRRQYQYTTFEICKAKNQPHARNRHLLKIVADPNSAVIGPGLGASPAYANSAGGVYVYPNVQRMLASDRSAITSSAGREACKFPVAGMELLLGSRRQNDISAGLPLDSTTVFVGSRGLLKSYIAYYWLLHQLAASPNDKALVLSLRDSSDKVHKTLRNLAEWEGLSLRDEALSEGGQLSVVHFRPGYLMPEELLHDVFIRLQGGVSCCVVDGLDHLGARLPLCSDQDLFVPALTQMLSGQGVTNVFTATSDLDGSTGQEGLLTVAEFIVRFGSPLNADIEGLSGEQFTKVTAERVPGGGIGGRSGVLYREHGTNRISFQPLAYKTSDVTHVS